MNILIVNNLYFPNIIGGAEVSVKLLAEGLKKEGNNVSVFCIDGKEKGILNENIDGINIYRSDSKIWESFGEKNNVKNSLYKRIINRFTEINNYYVGKNLKKVIKEFKPDVVHINNIAGMSSIVWKIIKKQKIKIIQTARDYYILNPEVNGVKKNNILKKFKIFLHQKIYKKRSYLVDWITAPSKVALEKMTQTGYFKNAKKGYVYNPIAINIEDTRGSIEEKKKRNNNKIRFMYAGRYSQEKGITNLLKAFDSIKNPNISLIFCGHGHEEEIINKYCKKDKRIKNLGMLNEQELKEEYKASDVIIVPSIWEEPFGRVVIEANQYGVPVIGSNRGGIKETLDLIHTGETYQYDNIEELKQKIEYFSNRDNIKKYYSAILENIEEYSVENHVKKYLEIYNG